MKKILALLLALSMLFALTACGGDNENTPTGESTGETTSTTESADDVTDGTEDSTQGTTEGTTGGETTDNTDDSQNTNTGENQTGTTDSVAPLKYTRDEFFAKVKEYIANHTPVETYHYEDDFDPQKENYAGKRYQDANFAENHEMNLFLHKTSTLSDYWFPGNNGVWVGVEQRNYDYTGEVYYGVGIDYTIPCETLTELCDSVRTDAYRLASFYGVPTSMLDIYTIQTTGGKKNIKLQLTDEEIERVITYETPTIGVKFTEKPVAGERCSLQIIPAKSADGKYEYTIKFDFSVSE